MGRTASLVGGMKLDSDPDDQVVGMVTVDRMMLLLPSLLPLKKAKRSLLVITG